MQAPSKPWQCPYSQLTELLGNFLSLTIPKLVSYNIKTDYWLSCNLSDRLKRKHPGNATASQEKLWSSGTANAPWSVLNIYDLADCICLFPLSVPAREPPAEKGQYEGEMTWGLGYWILLEVCHRRNFQHFVFSMSPNSGKLRSGESAFLNKLSAKPDPSTVVTNGETFQE